MTRDDKLRILHPTVRPRAFARLAFWAFCISLTAVPLLAQQAEQDAAESELPSGKEVYEKYLAAIGGREKLEQLKSTKFTGTINIQNIQGPIVIKRARPGMFSVHIEFPQLGSIDQGTDGENAWDVSPMQGARLLKGEERDEMIKRADFEEETNPEKYYKSIECTGSEQIDGVDCFVVEFTDEKDVVEKRYFDKDTHLLKMVETKRGGLMGTVKTSLGDYKDVDGLKLPAHHNMTVMGVKQEVNFDDLAINIELDAEGFAPPEAVAKIIEKKKEREAARSAEANGQ